MTFPPAPLMSYYTREQVIMIREVYSSITAEPWFTKNIAKRDEFAGKVLLMFNRGLIVPEKLHGFCHIMARHHYSEGVKADDIS